MSVIHRLHRVRQYTRSYNDSNKAAMVLRQGHDVIRCRIIYMTIISQITDQRNYIEPPSCVGMKHINVRGFRVVSYHIKSLLYLHALFSKITRCAPMLKASSKENEYN